jgi:hypothetical protein
MMEELLLKKLKNRKKKEDLEDIYAKGKSKKPLKDFKHFLHVASKVDVDLGASDAEKESNLQLSMSSHDSRNVNKINKAEEVGQYQNMSGVPVLG